MKKKILYVITKSNWGGAQRYVYDLATNLPRDHFDIAVATGRSPEMSEPRPEGTGGNGLLIEKLYKAGIRTINISAFQRDINIFKELAAFWQLFQLFRREKPDVIHLNSSKAGGIGAVAAFLYRILQPATPNLRPKVIFTAHGWGFNEPRPRWQRFFIKLATRVAALFQDKIIVINRADYAAARELISENKLAFIHNGVGRQKFLPRNEARKFLEKKIGQTLTTNTLIIGTIAELTKNKGIAYLIDAVNELRIKDKGQKIKTVIIGEGEDRKIMEEKIRYYHLADTVFLIGFVPDAAQYLKTFDIFVLPSLKEGLPYTLFEAMAAKLPTVATKVGGISDIIQNNKNGLIIPPADSKSLVTALETLTQDATTRTRFGKRAAEDIQTKFALDAMINRTVAQYIN